MPGRPCAGVLRGAEVVGVAFAIVVTAFAVHLVFPVGSEQFHVQLGMFPST